ncbi:MAG: pyrF [Rickettsiaceae bacterium]|jgi:orotidine-5'-phosphate decarboxylase|nr:pyrF [Rickettsiaceae bacterium]
MKHNPIICALDTKDITAAKKLCAQLQPHIGMIKLGLEFFTKNGPDGIRAVASSGIPIFLDLKFHDIPNTVAEAIRSAVSLDVSIITIHTLGGQNMMQGAICAARDEAERLGKKRPIIVGVTVLTSMDEADLNGIGVDRKPAQQVEVLAKLAKQSGLDGIVCSPHEIELVKKLCGQDFKTIVPGIRPAGGDNGDQKRVMTPKEAVDKGADFIVVGRPITVSDNPAKAAQEIFNSL